jgi:Rieske Fe-S protein
MKKTPPGKPAEREISRREFLKAAALAGGAAAAGNLLAGCAAQPASSGGGGQASPTAGGSSTAVTVDVTRPENQALSADGGAIALDGNALDPQGILVVRIGAGNFAAYSRRCTHTGCTVNAYQGGVAACPCHGSQFDPAGNVLRGPAGSPLKRYQAVLSGSIITIS